MSVHAQIPTVFKENAALAATRDRQAHVDVVLDAACKDYVQALRSGRPGWGLFRLTRAAERAERVLGPTDWSAVQPVDPNPYHADRPDQTLTTPVLNGKGPRP